MQFCVDAGAEGAGETELTGCKKTHQAHKRLSLFWRKSLLEGFALITLLIRGRKAHGFWRIMAYQIPHPHLRGDG
jgi:hypothetical protein